MGENEFETTSIRMTTTDLKVFFSSCYGFDISRKSGKREVVGAKKVYCQIAKRYGYGPSEIGKGIGITHDHVIYHNKNFSTISPMDLHFYNSAITYFNLPLEHITNINELLHGPIMSSIIQELKVLKPKDLMAFKRYKVKPFFDSLRKEKELKNMGNG